MRIVVTGATGVIGRSAVPRLVAAGHEVAGTHREPASARWLTAVGAEPVTVDLSDPDDVARRVRRADAVVHLATSIPPLADLGKRRAWAENDRLRDAACDLLVRESLRADVGVFVFASVTFNYVDGADDWIDEHAPVAPLFHAGVSALAGEAHVGRLAAAGRTGVVLRLSQLYGPGRASAEVVDALRRRRIPLVGSGRNRVSSIHVDDAADAVASAVSVPSGTYNVTDDDPMTSAERLALQCAVVGAPPPRRVPVAVARIAAGRAARMLTVSQRVSNRRFREVAGWRPQFASFADGWPTVVSSAPVARR